MQQLPGVSLSLMLGPVVAVPAPAFVMEALQSIEVTHTDNQASAFQLTFHADRTSAFAPDYTLMLSQLLSAGIRVVIVVTLSDGLPRTLSDGVITHLQLSHSRAAGGAVISVIGEDIGVLMDMQEVVMDYPALGDFEIVDAVLAKYALYGVIPTVMPTPTSMVSDPLERTPVQNSTDRAYIQRLGGLHGYVFMVRPGPAPMTNIAYWGPPPRVGLPQKTLTVDMGSATNVESIDFAYDGLAPTRYVGLVQDADTEADLPVATVSSMRIPLAAAPAILVNGFFVRESIFNKTGFAATDAVAYAQGMTDKSTDNVVTAQGEVDTLRYGAVMSTPGLVFVRGLRTQLRRSLLRLERHPLHQARRVPPALRTVPRGSRADLTRGAAMNQRPTNPELSGPWREDFGARFKPMWGKYRAKVVENVDPLFMGRLLVELAIMPGSTLNWCMPCVPYAGARVGFYAIPPIRANVWIEFEGGDINFPIWVGAFWGPGETPMAGAEPPNPMVKILKTQFMSFVLNDTLEVGGATLECLPGAVTTPLKMIFDSTGVTITAPPATLKMITEEGITLTYPPCTVSMTAAGVETAVPASTMLVSEEVVTITSPAIEMTAEGAASLSAGADVSLAAEGALSLQAGLAATVTAGEAASVTASGPLALTGAIVLIN